MSKPLIVYWSANSGGTKRLAENLDTETIPLESYDGTSPYVLMTPTYDQPRGGFTPRPVQDFLTEHTANMVGAIGTGNLNFGANYCQAAKDIAAQHDVPILHRVDLPGNSQDYRTIDRGMFNHWGELLLRRGIPSRHLRYIGDTWDGKAYVLTSNAIRRCTQCGRYITKTRGKCQHDTQTTHTPHAIH